MILRVLLPFPPGSSEVVMVGVVSTVIPSALEAASAVVRLLESAACTVEAVVVAGTVMVAMMRTLAASTRRATNDALTPASRAIMVCKFELSA